MKEIQSLLKIVSDGLKVIAQGIEAVSGKVDEIAKSQTVEKPKAKKPAPAAPKSKKAGKPAAKAPAKKAAPAATAGESVLKIISESQQGVDSATIMKKTGYDRKKVANMVYRLSKQGKIKSIQKGVYVKV
jgi:predicted Rossmann fold nucleotide-binding protein DprA/Smf involved in DNA uptake